MWACMKFYRPTVLAAERPNVYSSARTKEFPAPEERNVPFNKPECFAPLELQCLWVLGAISIWSLRDLRAWLREFGGASCLATLSQDRTLLKETTGGSTTTLDRNTSRNQLLSALNFSLSLYADHRHRWGCV